MYVQVDAHWYFHYSVTHNKAGNDGSGATKLRLYLVTWAEGSEW